VSSNGHGRTESTGSSLGLPTYEKHATTIFSLVPRRPGYVPQIQAILKASRAAWLALPGSVTHEVGLDNGTGSVVVVETYESSESMNDFEQSKEREAIISRLKIFIDESRTTVVRLPGSSAATRVVR
jgi:quinol monooxygenase YgiN